MLGKLLEMLPKRLPILHVSMVYVTGIAAIKAHSGMISSLIHVKKGLVGTCNGAFLPERIYSLLNILIVIICMRKKYVV